MRPQHEKVLRAERDMLAVAVKEGEQRATFVSLLVAPLAAEVRLQGCVVEVNGPKYWRGAEER